MLLHCIAKAEGVTKNSRGEKPDTHRGLPPAWTFPARSPYSTWLARQTIENQVHARTKKTASKRFCISAVTPRCRSMALLTGRSTSSRNSVSGLKQLIAKQRNKAVALLLLRADRLNVVSPAQQQPSIRH
jgi:hypothetical protein